MQNNILENSDASLQPPHQPFQDSESEKHGEPRNQVPEEGSESEEGCYEFPRLFTQFPIIFLVIVNIVKKVLTNMPYLA